MKKTENAYKVLFDTCYSIFLIRKNIHKRTLNIRGLAV